MNFNLSKKVKTSDEINKIYRSRVKINYERSRDFIVKLAETQDEFEQAFCLLHKAYVEEGLIAKGKNNALRMTYHHLLPSTSVVIAKEKGVVVGTLTLIRRAGWKLPMESLFDISHLTENGREVAEVSGLAVDKTYRKANSDVLFLLFKYMREYAFTRFGIDGLVLACNPKHIAFYEALILFERLPDGFAESYDFVEGAPAIAAHVDLHTLNRRCSEAYRGKVANRNLHHFFFETSFPNFRFPGRNPWDISDLNMSPECMKYFAQERTDLLAKLTPEEKEYLYSVYPYTLYRSVLPDRRKIDRSVSEDTAPCFATNFAVEFFPYKKIWPIVLEVRSIYENGLTVRFGRDSTVPDHDDCLNEGMVSFSLDEHPPIMLDVTRASDHEKNDNGLMRYRLEEENSNWRDIFHSLAMPHKNQEFRYAS